MKAKRDLFTEDHNEWEKQEPCKKCKKKDCKGCTDGWDWWVSEPCEEDY